MRTPIPATPQEVFDAVMRAHAIPWRPTKDPEADELSWMQLVRENRVPSEHCGLIQDLEYMLHHISSDTPFLTLMHLYAERHNLRFSVCTQ